MKKQFVKFPNLPQYDVKAVAIGEKYCKILEKSLNLQGIEALKIPDNHHLPIQVSSHADMSLCHLGGNKFAISKYIYSKFAEICQKQSINMEFYPTEHLFEEELNICIIGDTVLHRLNHSSEKIIDVCKSFGYIIRNTNQGYSKCSTCILNENSIITSDPSIHLLCTELGLNVLKITPGYIDLPGYDTGFIGGCSVKLSNKKIAFTGTLKRHPDNKRIEEFIEKNETEIIYLTDLNCFDVGSIIPIYESIN